MAGKIYITDDKKKEANKAASSPRRSSQNTNAAGRAGTAQSRSTSAEKTKSVSSKEDKEIEALARKMLKRREKRRRFITILVAVLAVASIGIFIYYSVTDYNASISTQAFKPFRKNDTTVATGNTAANDGVVINYDAEKEAPEVLPEFKDMLAVNSKLVGWLKLDPVVEGAKDGFPVAQTTDNEYYLNHDLHQNTDRNGTIFLDTNCDIIKPSTNFILYGHHMKSGNMFGLLEKYQDESYYEDHKLIYFDTIYEHGTYEVMYVFRSHVFAETEIAFKYYQFIDAYSEVEFDSYMEEMAAMSLYDTGVTASFGDRLLTLSTCDYQEKDGRFVVVAKKID